MRDQAGEFLASQFVELKAFVEKPVEIGDDIFRLLIVEQALLIRSEAAS